MNNIERYAVEMICDGAESRVEDDLNEDGKVTDEEHEAALILAADIIRAMRREHRGRQLLLWARTGASFSDPEAASPNDLVSDGYALAVAKAINGGDDE